MSDHPRPSAPADNSETPRPALPPEPDPTDQTSQVQSHFKTLAWFAVFASLVAGFLSTLLVLFILPSEITSPGRKFGYSVASFAVAFLSNLAAAGVVYLIAYFFLSRLKSSELHLFTRNAVVKPVEYCIRECIAGKHDHLREYEFIESIPWSEYIDKAHHVAICVQGWDGIVKNNRPAFRRLFERKGSVTLYLPNIGAKDERQQSVINHIARRMGPRSAETQVAEIWNTYKLLQEIRDATGRKDGLLMEPGFGTPVCLEMRYFASKPKGDRWGLYSAFRSFLLSHANHAVDLMAFFLGRVSSVVCARVSFPRDGVALTAQFAFERRASANLLATTCAPNFSVHASVISDQNRIVCMDSLRELSGSGFPDDPKYWTRKWHPSTLLVGFKHAGYQAELADFLFAVRGGGGARAEPSLADEVPVYEVLDGIESCIATG